ncbi:MAG: hypothetical protein QW292_14225 [Candidatus Parvarchaeota archaeon]
MKSGETAKKVAAVILEIMPASVGDNKDKAFEHILREYDIRECIIISDRGLASYDMPERKGIYMIVAIKKNSKIIDYSMKLNRSFIYRDRGINSGKKSVNGKYLYIYEDASMRAEEETNIIKKIENGDLKL